MVGRGRTQAGEISATVTEGGEVAGPARGILIRELGQAPEVCRETLELGIDHRVGAESRKDAAGPAAVANGAVVRQVVGRGLRGGDHLDAEPLEQGARAERVRAERGVDHVEINI